MKVSYKWTVDLGFHLFKSFEYFVELERILMTEFCFWSQCFIRNLDPRNFRILGFKSAAGSSPTPSVLTMMSVSTQSDNNQQYLMRLLNWTSVDVSRWLADNGLTLVQERSDAVLWRMFNPTTLAIQIEAPVTRSMIADYFFCIKCQCSYRNRSIACYTVPTSNIKVWKLISFNRHFTVFEMT